MSSKIAKPSMRSAAWRISFWATLAYALGILAVFFVLQQFVAADIQRRTDAWLSGEVQVLGDVAGRVPQNALHNRIVREVAELASREVPNRLPGSGNSNDSVFFLKSGADGALQLWVGAGDGQASLAAISRSRTAPDRPTDVKVPGHTVPFRVAWVQLKDGSHIFLGLSERDELRVLRALRIRFLLLGIVLILLGGGIVFLVTRRMLNHVREISDAASRIGRTDLTTRVPTSNRNDEIAQLASTLNRMLDRIENSMRQLHTITDSLAHDLRSPLTAIRGKLEMSLADSADDERCEPIVAAIEELDRLADFLNTSLDVAEARADALRLTRVEIDLKELLGNMINLYEPSMSDKGLKLRFHADEGVRVFADAALLHRMIANLMDNELKHLPVASRLTIEVRREEDLAQLILEDDGPGFGPEVLEHLFERRVKGRNSSGHGLGLSFVDAVARAHGGMVRATNKEGGGARIIVTFPLAETQPFDLAASTHAE